MELYCGSLGDIIFNDEEIKFIKECESMDIYGGGLVWIDTSTCVNPNTLCDNRIRVLNLEMLEFMDMIHSCYPSSGDVPCHYLPNWLKEVMETTITTYFTT